MHMAQLFLLLASIAPWSKPETVARYSIAISIASEDEIESVALAVTAVRESRLSLGCPEGVGGLGGFQLNPQFYGRKVACGSLAEQAWNALELLRRGGLGRTSEAHAFGRYIGATARHPEAVHRERLFYQLIRMYHCQCSVL